MNNKLIKKTVISAIMLTIAANISFAKPAVTIEVKSINALIPELTNLATKLSPQLPAAMLPSIIGMGIKNPNLADIDLTKPIQIQVSLSAAGTTPAVVLCFPILNNGKNYLALLKQSNGTVANENGITTFTPLNGKALHLAINKNHILISDNKNAIKKAKESNISSDSLLDINGTIRIGITPKELIPFIKSNSQKLSQQPAMPGVPIDTSKVLNVESDALIAILEQIDGTAFGIKINNDTIDITSRINPAPGSTIAKLNQELKVPATKYSSLAPADALFATSGSGMNSFDKLIEPYGKLITEIYSDMGPEFSKLAPAMNKMIVAYKGLYSGDYAAGVISNGKTLGFYEVFALTDANKAKTTMEQQLAEYSKSLGQSLGTEIIFNKDRTYKNIEVNTISYKASDTIMGTPTPEITKTMMNKLKSEVAYTKDSMIYTIGSPKTMNTIIDRLTSKTANNTPSAQFKKLIPNPKGRPVASYTLSLSGIIKALLLMSPNVTETMLAGNSTADGIAGYAITNGTDIIALDRISINELVSIKDMTPTIQSTVMSLMMSTQMQMIQPPTH